MGSLKDAMLGDRPYPQSPGYSEPTTSRASARAIASTAETMRQRVYETIRAVAGGLTADEVASRLNLTVLNVRPRVCELHEFGRIKPSGVKRPNASGHKAHVWIVA